MRKKSSVPSASKIAAYAGAFLLLVAVIAIGYESPQPVSSQVAVVGEKPQVPLSGDAIAPTVDKVVATDIAADFAGRANLPVARSLESMATTLTTKSELAQTDTSAITKPQIIQPNSTRTDIITYKTVAGDTVPSIAAKYGISQDTVRWSNGINGDAVEPGRALSILPTNGLIHKVAAGDTLQSIADKYNANTSRISLVNNIELTGVTAGQTLIIPDGVKPAPAPTPALVSGDSRGGSRLGSTVFASAGNRYAPGNCTWYAYERRAQLGRPVGSFWGNANTWASSARSAGFLVDRSPSAGAVLVDQAGYFGHVAVVERVLANGDVYITEMNNYAYGGFNQVNDRTISAGQASAYLYIH